MPFDPTEVRLREWGPEAPYDWKLVDELTYTHPESGPVTVPENFQTDLASVPHLLTWYVPRYGLYTKAAILHDSLCRSREVSDRFDTDRIFRQTMAELDVPLVRRWLMWTAVSWVTILSCLLKRLPLTILALAAVWFGVGAYEPLDRFGLLRGSLLTVGVVLTLVIGICLSYARLPRLAGWLVVCYLLTIPGSLLLAVCVPLVLVLLLSVVVELVVDRRRLMRRWRSWYEPLGRVLLMVVTALLRRLVGRPPGPQFDSRAVHLAKGTAREQRLAKLLDSNTFRRVPRD